MIQAIDFSDYELNNKYYGGSERKEGICIDGEDYMIKYRKATPFGPRNNHISEFLGSHIFELCGIQSHQTYLGYRNGEQVVACKDFNGFHRSCKADIFTIRSTGEARSFHGVFLQYMS